LTQNDDEVRAQTGPLLRIILYGGFFLGAVLIIFGLYLISQGSSEETKIIFLGQTFESSSVGLGAIFIGAILVIVLIREVLNTFREVVKPKQKISKEAAVDSVKIKNTGAQDRRAQEKSEELIKSEREEMSAIDLYIEEEDSNLVRETGEKISRMRTRAMSAKIDELNDRLESLLKQKSILSERLANNLERKMVLGKFSTPPSLLMEIKHIELEINRIDEEINYVKLNIEDFEKDIPR
jgi:hypothetical protein